MFCKGIEKGFGCRGLGSLGGGFRFMVYLHPPSTLERALTFLIKRYLGTTIKGS